MTRSASPARGARSGSGWGPPPLWARLPMASRALPPIWASCWRSSGSSAAPSAAWASSWSMTRAVAAAEEDRPTTMSRMLKCVRVCVCVWERVWVVCVGGWVGGRAAGALTAQSLGAGRLLCCAREEERERWRGRRQGGGDPCPRGTSLIWNLSRGLVMGFTLSLFGASYPPPLLPPPPVRFPQTELVLNWPTGRHRFRPPLHHEQSRILKTKWQWLRYDGMCILPFGQDIFLGYKKVPPGSCQTN